MSHPTPDPVDRSADVRYWRELAREAELRLRRIRHELAEACERTQAERRRPDLDHVLLDDLLGVVAAIATRGGTK